MDGHPIILLVEDEPLIRMMMQDQLEDWGFSAVCVADAEAAIEVIDRLSDIAALFADIDLGPRGCGYDVARHARAHRPCMKIIYTSGGARGDYQAERVEGALFVPKPYAPSTVCDLLERTIAEAA